MNEEKRTDMTYEAPTIEVLEVEVEKGFAQSMVPTNDGEWDWQ